MTPRVPSRAWVAVMAVGWLALAFATFTSDNVVTASPVWWVGAAINGVLSFLLLLDRRPDLYPKWCKAVTMMVVAYGMARGATYAADGIWSPAAIWSLYATLAMHAYGLARDADRARRGRS